MGTRPAAYWGVPVAQPAEAVDLKSTQCGFESRRGHQRHEAGQQLRFVTGSANAIGV